MEGNHVSQLNNKVVSTPAKDDRKVNPIDVAVESNSVSIKNLSGKGSDFYEDDLTSGYDSSSTTVFEMDDKSYLMQSSQDAHLKDECFNLDVELSHEVGKNVYDISSLKSVAKFAHACIESGLETASFLITNLTTVTDQVKLWKYELPMVEPFYAVKCNPDIAIVRTLAAHGCCFDCATQGEIDMVLHHLGDELSFGSRGKAGTSIVYANPAKMIDHLKYAIDNGVRMTVFDGEDELEKIASIPGHENLELLLRLTTDDRASICQFSKKFGCPVRDAPNLLRVAKSLGLNVAGVSFHVGSGCGDPNAYVIAFDHTRQVFDAADELGMKPLHIIDIGGGFPGGKGGEGVIEEGPKMPTFQELSAAVRSGIKNFSIGFKRPMSEIRIIAEPGRFFASACTTVATKVYARKGGRGSSQALYVDDGVYGTFNNIVYDHARPVPQKLISLVKDVKDEPLLPTIVFGPTCDGLDQLCSLEKTRLPRCEVNDWLYWDDMGAYTHTASFLFNGYTHIPERCYCVE